MNVLVLSGSPRKKHSYTIVKAIEAEAGPTVTFDWIFLKEEAIDPCCGCMNCFRRSEHHCPHSGDAVESIVDKMVAADKVIIASPVYAYQVPGPLKNFIDRTAYLCHRPKFLFKPAFTVVTTDGGGAGAVSRYLKMMGMALGLDIRQQLDVISPFYFDTPREKIRLKTNRAISKLSESLKTPTKKELPSYRQLFMFQCLKSKTYTSSADADYWREKGWLDADYFTPEALPFLKKCFSRLLGQAIGVMGRRYKPL